MAKTQSEPKTAWGKHIRAYMEANPGLSYRDALIQESRATKMQKPSPLK